MARLEILLVAILIAIALILGILFGGSTVYFLKPESSTRVVDNSVTKYVCSDGQVKDDLSQCPKVQTSETGETTVVCPPCSNTTEFLYRKCDCTACTQQCGIIPVPGESVTTTTIHVVKCSPCSSDTDCGQPEYSDIKCSADRMYRIEMTPICDDGCCKTMQEQKIIRTCTSAERCQAGKGCVPYED